MDVAVHGIVHRGDVLGIARDRGVCHDGVGIWGFINGFELQPLVMDPKVWRFDIFGVALVLVGAVHGFAGGTFPGKEGKAKEISSPVGKGNFSLAFPSVLASSWAQVSHWAGSFEFCTQAPLTPQSTSWTLVPWNLSDGSLCAALALQSSLH